MLIPFENMPETSKLWIYQAARKLSQKEVKLVEEEMSGFLANWTSHGRELKASFKVEYDQFLILTEDESISQASGCSIDASVDFIRKLGGTLGVSFMNNNKVAFLIEDEVELLLFKELKKKVQERRILPGTRVFNNTVQNLCDFKLKWLVESGKTWLGRYFN